MKWLKIILFSIICFANIANAFDRKVLWKARVLERAAYEVADILQNETGYSHISADARRFAREVSQFHETVASGASDYVVQKEFRFIRRKYYHLVSTFKRAHDVHHHNYLAYTFKKMKRRYARLREQLFYADPKFNPYHPKYTE